jgi:hypothetical protein
MVAQRTLDPLIQVRVLAPQPKYLLKIRTSVQDENPPLSSISRTRMYFAWASAPLRSNTRCSAMFCGVDSIGQTTSEASLDMSMMSEIGEGHDL